MQSRPGGRLLSLVTAVLVSAGAVLVVADAPSAGAEPVAAARTSIASASAHPKRSDDKRSESKKSDDKRSKKSDDKKSESKKSDDKRSGSTKSEGTRADRKKKKPSVSATARFRATVTVRRHFDATVRVTVSAKATVVSHADTKGKPTGRATVQKKASASARARSYARAVATARATADGTGTTRKQALAAARDNAKHAARAHATRKARGPALDRAVAKARAEARRRATKAARAAAYARAHQQAAHLARLRRIDPHDPTTWLHYRPRAVTPPSGAHFNDPYAGFARRRENLAQVIRAVKSSPGYKLTTDPKTGKRLTCPSQKRYWPSTIRIAVYSIADRRFANAIAAAQRRCVSVQVLMNSHLTSVTSPSWGTIHRVLGSRSAKHWKTQRSFAHRCSNGCLGTSVLHAKFYLFSHAGHTRDTVMTGSSNMTTNAVRVQWNDLYTVNDDQKLYRQFDSMFTTMVPDHRGNGPYVFHAGRFITTFYPDRHATAKTDRTMHALRTIRCTGAEDGTGIHGRTVVYIAMHAWFSARGRYLAGEVRDLYRRGCYVRVLYSFMSYPTYLQLKSGTGARMVVRRVLFSGPLGLVAVKYSHMKMFAVSGHIGSDHSSKVVWTGSNNWVDKSLRADEVTLRIASGSAYDKYVRHWKFMNRRHSTAYWATFEEPTGGGRAP